VQVLTDLIDATRYLIYEGRTPEGRRQMCTPCHMQIVAPGHGNCVSGFDGGFETVIVPALGGARSPMGLVISANV